MLVGLHKSILEVLKFTNKVRTRIMSLVIADEILKASGLSETELLLEIVQGAL